MTQRKKLRLLWLEDDTMHFKTAVQTLNKLGVSTTFVSTKEELIDKLGAEYDVVLLDIRGAGAFNGISLLQDKEVDFGNAKVALFSGFLRSHLIEKALMELDEEVALISKSYDVENSESISKVLFRQIKEISEGSYSNTNRNFFAKANPEDFPAHDRHTSYTEFHSLNDNERRIVLSKLLDMAEPEVQMLENEGYSWFLISGPDGDVVDKDEEDRNWSSARVELESVSRGFPCIVYSTDHHVEEVKPASCGGMYKYYFSVRLAFEPGKAANSHDLHFDSGSNNSWYDWEFLKDNGIGVAGSPNAFAKLATNTGVRNVSYYKEDNRPVYVHSQDQSDNVVATKANIRGIDVWDEMPFSGHTTKLSELCDECKDAGRCKARRALLGQDLLGTPDGFSLELDGRTKRSTPKKSVPKRRRRT